MLGTYLEQLDPLAVCTIEAILRVGSAFPPVPFIFLFPSPFISYKYILVWVGGLCYYAAFTISWLERSQRPVCKPPDAFQEHIALFFRCFLPLAVPNIKLLGVPKNRKKGVGSVGLRWVQTLNVSHCFYMLIPIYHLIRICGP